MMMVNRAALCFCALAFLSGNASAQQSKPFLHDDLSGMLKDQFIHKSDGRNEGAGARLRFDIDYEYKASLLMGEPVVVCSAKISNPRGEISFRYGGEYHTVTINNGNAKLLSPYNVDYAITYKSVHADNASFLARCNTGIPGSSGHEALNVPASPDWGDFMCWAAGSGFSRPDPMPDSVPDDWCRAFGQGAGRTLNAEEAKKRFAVTAASDGGAITRAVEVDVASFAINYNDLIVAEIKKISAKKIAERKFDQTRQIRGTLHQPQGAAARAAQQLDTALNKARSMGDPREQARLLQGVMRDVLNIPPTEDGVQAFVELRTSILNLLSSDGERSFVAGIKQDLSSLQAATDQSTQAIATIFDKHRAAAANAPKFAFASSQTHEAGKEYPSLVLLKDRCGSNHQEGVWYADQSGACIAGPFRTGEEFSEGFAAVRLSKTEATFIDAKGVQQFKRFDSAESFSEGYAVVSHTGKKFKRIYSLIDRNGAMSGEYQWAGRFSHGFAPVSREKGTYTYVDAEGKEHFGNFFIAEPFYNGRAVVRRLGEIRTRSRDPEIELLDTTGNFIGPYFAVGDRHGADFIAVQGVKNRSQDEGWGIVDAEGKQIIPFEYARVHIRRNEEGQPIFRLSTSIYAGNYCKGVPHEEVFIEVDAKGRKIHGPETKHTKMPRTICGSILTSK